MASSDRSAAPTMRPASTNGERAEDRQQMRASSEVVIGGSVWPQFAPGQYVVEVISSREKLSPWTARDLAAKRRRPDPEVQHWKWLLDVRVEAGTDGHTARALDLWRRKHNGCTPVTFFSCPFKRATRSGRIVTPRRGEKLFESLQVLIGRPLLPGDRLRLDAFVGARVVAKIVDSSRDADGDRRPSYATYSLAKKLLSLCSVPASKPSADSRQPVAYSRHSAQEEQRDRVVPERTSSGDPDSAEGDAGVVPPIRETVYDRLGDAGDDSASPGPTPTQERAQLEHVFGRGSDVAPRGPCPRCGERMFARFGETARCIWCAPDGSER